MRRRLKYLYFRVFHFLKTDIWALHLDQYKPRKALMIRVLRVIVLAFDGFREDKCTQRASSLTFYTLLSIVPVLAMAFGLAKGFGLERFLERRLHEALEGHQEVLDMSLDLANSMLETTKGGTIAGIGFVLLLFTIMRLLNKVEEAFNEIWEVKRSRSFSRKFTDYMAIMTIAPITIVLAGGVTAFISTQITTITKQIELLEMIAPVILLFVKFIPYTLIWIFLTIIYIIIPHTKVNFKSALIAGILAGTSYQLTQWGYINFQVGVSRYNAIYGSFAALPLFLIWTQISWLLILLGGEIAFAIQHANSFVFKDRATKMSIAFRRKLSLLVIYHLVKSFVEAKPPLSEKDLSDKLDVPVHFIRQVADVLKDCRLIVEIKGEDEYRKFQPAQDIDQITMALVISKLDQRGIDKFKILESPELEQINKLLKQIDTEQKNSSANIALRNLNSHRT